MLPLSHKPEVLRLHNLQSAERTKFCSSWTVTLNELLPPPLLRRLASSSLLSQLAATLPDLYYTFVTICHCRRRLGEQYTYVAMYHPQHYQQQGVLLNKKTRTLLFVLEIAARHLLKPILLKTLQNSPTTQTTANRNWLPKVAAAFKRLLGQGEELTANLEWLVLMLYMLDWNKHYSLIETLLGIQYAYTYKNDKPTAISYRIEGYLILATLALKLARHLLTLYHQTTAKQQPTSATTRPANRNQTGSLGQQRGSSGQQRSEKVLCRICYDEMKERSATRCGHVFCWECIVKTLEIGEECPVCRTSTSARQVVQLRNY